MAAEFDIDPFFDYDTLAVSGYYEGTQGSGVIPLVFDREGQFTDSFGVQVETHNPTAYVRIADVSGLSNRDTLTIPYPAGVLYHVLSVKADPSDLVWEAQLSRAGE